jgi:hypothetical protein
MSTRCMKCRRFIRLNAESSAFCWRCDRAVLIFATRRYFAESERESERLENECIAAPFVTAALNRLDAIAVKSAQRRAESERLDAIRSEYPDIFAREAV